MSIGLGKGKKKYDKREDLKQKEAKREIERVFRIAEDVSNMNALYNL